MLLALVEALEAHWLPEALPHIHLTSGGSESVETAVKLAAQFHTARGEPDRSLVIARSPSYHGTTLTTAMFSLAKRSKNCPVWNFWFSTAVPPAMPSTDDPPMAM